jgi:hypothetical protein
LLSPPVKVIAPRYRFNALAVKQISAIAAYAGLSVEVKESTSDIIKTPTLTSKDGFSVFEASAIGRYSESYCLALHEEVKRRRLSQTSPTPIHVNGKHEGPVCRTVSLVPEIYILYCFRLRTIDLGRRHFVDEFIFACSWVSSTLLTNLTPSRVAGS